MTYEILCTVVPTGAVIDRERFQDLDEALRSAAYVTFGGPHEVQITVSDENGIEYDRRIVGVSEDLLS